MNFLSDEKMDQIFAPLQQVTASSNLHARAAHLAQQSAIRSRPRLAFALAGVCAAGLLIGVAMLPGKAKASMLDRMARAVGEAKSVHWRGYGLVDGNWVLTSENWYANGNWRLQDESGTQVYGDGKKWSYRPDQGIALESDRSFGQEPEGAQGVFGITSSYAVMNRKGFHFSLTYGSPEREGARTVVPVLVTRPGHETERDVFLVEKDTDLPLSGESQVLVPGGWQTRLKWSGEYDVPIPPSTFTAEFPSGTKILDRSAFSREWAQKLEKPIVSAQIAGDTVSIRNVFVNSKGWVFLLWTGQIGGQDYRLFLRDDQGGTYTRACFDPGNTPYEGSQAEPLYVGRKLVDGAWFVPLEPTKVTTPRNFTMRILTYQVPAGTPNSGVYKGWVGRRPFEPETTPFFGGTKVDPILKVAGEIVIPRVSPSTGTLPAYLPVFSSGPTSEPWADSLAVEARKHYWMLRLSTDRLEEPRSRALVPPLTMDGESIGSNVQLVVPGEELPGNSDRNVLMELNKIEHELVESEYRISPSGSGSGFEWFELSAVQRALRDDQAAEQSLETAERLRPEIRWRRQ